MLGDISLQVEETNILTRLNSGKGFGPLSPPINAQWELNQHFVRAMTKQNII